MLRPAHLVDITVKDGGFKVEHCLLPRQVGEIAAGLAHAGIHYAEISHGLGLGAFARGYAALASDVELLKAAREQAPRLQRIVFISGKGSSPEDIQQASGHFEIGRIASNVENVESIAPLLSELRQHTKPAWVQLVRIHHFSPEQVAAAAKAAVQAGAELVYLSDSYGSLDHREVASYFQALQEAVSCPLGFQARNYSHRALENTLAAWQAGAEWLDGALLGFGRGAGVTQLEVLATHLKQQGAAREINVSELCFAAQSAAKILHHAPYVNYAGLLLAKHQLDYSPETLLEAIADIVEVDLEALILSLKRNRPGMMQVTEQDLRKYLAEHRLDLEVVMEFLQTGDVAP